MNKTQTHFADSATLARLNKLEKERDIAVKALEKIGLPDKDSSWPKVTELMDIAEEALKEIGDDR